MNVVDRHAFVQSVQKYEEQCKNNGEQKKAVGIRL